MEKQEEKSEKPASSTANQPANKSARLKENRSSKEYGFKCVGKAEMEEIVDRLCQVRTRVPDSQRTGAIKEMGIQNSFLWKGFN